MSEENIELARRIIAAWIRGDMARWGAGLDEAIAWVPLDENTQTKPVVGKDKVLRFVADWIKPWEAYKIEATRIIGGGDWILMSTRQTGTLQAGGEISMEMHAACLVRDGKLVEARWFMDEGAALEAAGLTDDHE